MGAVVSIGLTTLLLLAAANLTDVSIYALNLVYALGIGLSIDFNLLIVSRFREELDRGVAVTTALERTLSTAGRTVLFSAATVTAALGALIIFPLSAISSMGLAGMLVTLCSAANALLVLPAVLALLGTRVDALALWRRPHSAGSEATRGFWFRLSGLVMRRPATVAVVTAAALLGIGSVALGVAFTTYNTKELPQNLHAVQVAERMQSDFHGLSASPLELVVSASGGGGASAVAAYTTALSHVPGIEAVAPPVMESAGLWEVDASMSSPGISTAAVDTLHRVEALPTALTVRATGQTAFFVAEETSLGSALPWAALALAITTLVILFLMTGSVVLPVKALLMNGLTLGATLGILVLVFQHGFLSGVLGFTTPGGIDLETPVLVGALAFGLSTDYGVFLLSRIREEYLGGLRTREAIAVGLQRVGRVVTAAAALFCIAVGALALSTTIVLKEIGLGAAVAVLIDASIVRALLVPSVMALLGRWNWYAPRWLTTFHRRLPFDLPEGPARLPEGSAKSATV
jgi:RND superfamily putative drug exporter